MVGTWAPGGDVQVVRSAVDLFIVGASLELRVVMPADLSLLDGLSRIECRWGTVVAIICHTTLYFLLVTLTSPLILVAPRDTFSPNRLPVATGVAADVELLHHHILVDDLLSYGLKRGLSLLLGRGQNELLRE